MGLVPEPEESGEVVVDELEEVVREGENAERDGIGINADGRKTEEEEEGAKVGGEVDVDCEVDSRDSKLSYNVVTLFGHPRIIFWRSCTTV